MSKDSKGYYKALGVDPTATADDIKKAYRKKAMKCHPDQNLGDKKAEEDFKALSEAYEVLSDDSKRHMYDMPNMSGTNIFGGSGFNFEDILGKFGQGFGGATRNRRRPPSFDVRVPLRIALSDAIKGGKVSFSFVRLIACDDCKGLGNKKSKEKCGYCAGNGVQGNLINGMTINITCNACEGTGSKMIKCKVCEGKAYSRKVEKVVMSIPPGIARSANMRLENKGNIIIWNGKKVNGHAFAVVDYPKEQDGIMFDNGNIYVIAKIPFDTIISGSEITIKIFDAKSIAFKPDIENSSGHTYCIKGGSTAKGKDAFVKVFIDIPKNKISEAKRKKLVKELEDIYGKANTTFTPATVH